MLRSLVKGKRNKDIADAISISPKTVSTYRARIMKKLKAKNLIDLVRKTQHIDLDLY